MWFRYCMVSCWNQTVIHINYLVFFKKSRTEFLRKRRIYGQNYEVIHILLSNKEAALIPNSWYFVFAITTFIAIHGILENCVTHSFYDDFLTVWTVGAFAGMTWYIARIREIQASFYCYISCLFQCLCWSRWQVLNLVCWVET